jgi:hypothetical protein
LEKLREILSRLVDNLVITDEELAGTSAYLFDGAEMPVFFKDKTLFESVAHLKRAMGVHNITSIDELDRCYGHKRFAAGGQVDTGMKDFVPDYDLQQFISLLSNDRVFPELGQYSCVESPCGKYSLIYNGHQICPVIKEFTQQPGYCAAYITIPESFVSNSSKIVGTDFIFYILMWTFCMAYVAQENKTPDNYLLLRTDFLAIQYYFTTGRSIKDLNVGLFNLFSKFEQTMDNSARYNSIVALVKSCERKGLL